MIKKTIILSLLCASLLNCRSTRYRRQYICGCEQMPEAQFGKLSDSAKKVIFRDWFRADSIQAEKNRRALEGDTLRASCAYYYYRDSVRRADSVLFSIIDKMRKGWLRK